MSLVHRMLAMPVVYRAWQAPFADQKIAPIWRNTDIRKVRRVLDVGCGPGTNTRFFENADYLGVDINRDYVRSARSRYGRSFVTADVTAYTVPNSARFDFVLINSFLHHLESAAVRRVLSSISGLLTDDGHVHVLELVLPRRGSVAHLLARADRGKFARPVEAWRALFNEAFEPVILEPYTLSFVGLPLWHMVYFKGRARR